jgi:hypothetical protein
LLPLPEVNGVFNDGEFTAACVSGDAGADAAEVGLGRSEDLPPPIYISI